MFGKILGLLLIASTALGAYSPAVNQGSAGSSKWLVDGSGVTQPVSGTVGITTSDTQPATQNVTTLDLVSAPSTGANGQTLYTGTPTAGSVATFSLSSLETVNLQVTGTWTGALQTEISIDGGTNWLINGVHQTGTTYTSSTFTANFAGGLNVSGATNFRVRAIAAMTGTAVVKVIESYNSNSIYIANSLQISDGAVATNKLTVKGASTAPVAADTSVVVTESPNSPIIAPLANIGSASTMTEDFSAVVASGISSPNLTLIQTGSGMTVSQSSGNLVVASGTTANSETIIRSNAGFTGSLIVKEDSILSQRIANNNFYVEMVDYPAGTTAASYTINSATSVTVTFTTNPFTSANVGQFMYLGGITGAAGIPMRAAIASVAGSTVTYTVAGWPASGTGTILVFGWNYYHLLYTGTTVTNANVGTQREGWQNADYVATINTTASPGHLATMQSEDNTFAVWDQLVASVTSAAAAMRAQLYQNIPPYTTPLYLQIHALNGTTAPASTTTWTVASVQVDQITSNPVTIGNIKQQSLQGQLPVFVANTANVSVTNTPNVSVSSDSLAINTSTNDLVSVAKTSTFTLAVTPAVASGQAYSFQLNSTAVTGTTPTMDCQILESYDGGVTYPKVIYQFERVTGVLATPLVTPMLRVSGKAFEYNCIIAGTTPSFTMALWRVGSVVATPIRYNLYDRSMAPGTSSSAGTTWFTEGCTSGQIFYYQSAVTTSPVLSFQTSPDQLVWASTTYTMTPTSTAGLYLLPLPAMNAKYSRIFTTTGGTGVTYVYTNLTCSGT